MTPYTRPAFTVPEGDTGQRWLLHTDRMGREIVTPLLPETVIATPDRLVKMFIKTPDKLHMSPEQQRNAMTAKLAANGSDRRTHQVDTLPEPVTLTVAPKMVSGIHRHLPKILMTMTFRFEDSI